MKRLREVIALMDFRHFNVLTTFMCNSITCGMSYANSSYYYGHWLETLNADSGLTAMIGSLNMGLVCLTGMYTPVHTDVFYSQLFPLVQARIQRGFRGSAPPL